jgi:hypothetical protein
MRCKSLPARHRLLTITHAMIQQRAFCGRGSLDFNRLGQISANCLRIYHPIATATVATVLTCADSLSLQPPLRPHGSSASGYHMSNE